MNEEKFLAKSAFDAIIASLEALLLEVQNLVASVDPLNDPQVIADIQSVADQLAEILTVAGISGDITTVAGESANITVIADNITQIQSIVDELQDILAVAAELPAIQTVAGDTAAVNAVAGSILAVQEVAANIQAVIDAVQAALDAAQARDAAQTWAEGTDEAVGLLGGEKSSRGWAGQAKLSNDTAAAYANFQGRWEDATGSYSPPAAFLHNNLLWGLVEAVSDITQSEPSTANPDWILLSSREITGIGATEQIDPLDFTIGGGESVYDTGYTTDILLFLNGAQLAASNYDKTGTVLTIHHELQPNDEVVILRFDALEIQSLPEKPIVSTDKLLLEDVSGEKFASDPIGILTGVYDSWRVRDLFSQQWSSATTGSATLRRDNSSGLYPMYELLTGDDPDSNGAIATGYRMYYSLSGNMPSISEMRQVFYFTVRVQDITPETIFRIYNYMVQGGINLPLSNDTFEGAGIEMRDNGELWFQVRPGNGTFQEVRMNYDFPNLGTLRFKIDYNFAQDIIEVCVNNSLVASVAINHTQFSNTLSAHQANIQLLNGSSPTGSTLIMAEAMQLVRVI